MASLATALAQATARLASGPHPQRARLDAESLLMHLTGKNRAWLLAHATDEFGGCTAINYAALVERRLRGEPIQYITGSCEFYGLPFRVTPAVLIPRPETEHLVEKALALANTLCAPSIRRTLPDGWERDPALNSNNAGAQSPNTLGAPGLDSETWDTTNSASGNASFHTTLGAPSIRRTLPDGWERDPASNSNNAGAQSPNTLGAPGLDPETWDTTNSASGNASFHTTLGAPSIRRTLPDGWERDPASNSNNAGAQSPNTLGAPGLDPETWDTKKARILDIGTGSGAIAIALAYALPHAHITAVDLSPTALAIAQSNAEQNGVASRIRFLESDLLSAVSNEKFDLIVSNPPYVPESDRATLAVEVRDHEPSVALFAGDNGLAIYRRLIPNAARALTPNGSLLLEIGHGQAPAIRELLIAAGFAEPEFTPDLQGIPRVASAALQAATVPR